VPSFRYVVPGLPPEQHGRTAFAPVFPGYAASGRQAYKYAVTSWLGRVAAPAPTVNTQISPDAGDKAQMGYSRSSDAPDAWYPQKGYQGEICEPPGAGMPIQVYDMNRPGLTTVLPVPAVAVAPTSRRDSATLARPALLNRARQLPWWPRTRVTPDWPAGG
jgi:hypothetical protein